MDRRSFLTATATAVATLGTPAVARADNPERSPDFKVSVDGKDVPVQRAAAGYSFVTLDLTSPVELAVDATEARFWERGVDVLPSRHGIRPRRDGGRIAFRLEQPVKLAVSRPGDYSADARMLFVFANRPDAAAPAAGAPGVRYFGPGIHREHIHVKSNETVYLAEGAIVYGSLNFWDVENAKVFGRGVVIHDGPQNPNDDEGWLHKPDWHAITMHDARNVEVRGITCVVRSRTWMIQLQGSKGVVFDNIKVIGGTRGNANQDGIDWLGCGDTVVRDCFFRCSDDIFAIYGNTGFYDKDAALPGRDVRNILIERCVLSTSISNVMRVSWRNKVFNSGGITLRDSDVIHMGMGGCTVPFALLDMWDQPAGSGVHEDYLFEDIRLDSWYSLAQIHRPDGAGAQVRNIRFVNIRSVDRPALAPSTIRGNVKGIVFDRIRYGDSRLERGNVSSLEPGLQANAVVPDPAPAAEFSYPAGPIAVGSTVRFTARAIGRNARYQWNFGDGTTAQGAVVEHVFRDRDGSLLDGSGRFRVQLTVTDGQGHSDTVARPVVVGASLLPATAGATDAGLRYRFIDGLVPDLQAPGDAGRAGVTAVLVPRDLPRHTRYTLVLEGLLEVPDDGGYTFTMTARDGARLMIDDVPVLANQGMQPQVCDTTGSIVQQASGAIGLRRGLHRIAIAFRHGLGDEDIALYWQGPRITLQRVPANALRRKRT